MENALLFILSGLLTGGIELSNGGLEVSVSLFLVFGVTMFVGHRLKGKQHKKLIGLRFEFWVISREI